MKKDNLRDKSKENIKEKKISKRKSKEKEDKIDEPEKKNNFTPEIEETEEEKIFIKRDMIPEGILDNEFQEQLPSISGKSKVSLDRVNIQRTRGFNLDDFVENSPINQTQKPAWQEDFDPLKYSSGIKNSNEPKYLDYDGSFTPTERVDLNSFSITEDKKAKFQFNPMNKQEEKSIETYVPAQKINDRELMKRNKNIVDSSKEIKYTPSKY